MQVRRARPSPRGLTEDRLGDIEETEVRLLPRGPILYDRGMEERKETRPYHSRNMRVRAPIGCYIAMILGAAAATYLMLTLAGVV